MKWNEEWKPLAWSLAVFLMFFYLPLGISRFDNALMEGLHLVKWYAREHVILCLVPAFFIAGAMTALIPKEAITRYLGKEAPRWLSYPMAAVGGFVLAVCSCTILPLFASIYKKGAGLGPAITFLFVGPAINILAVTYTGVAIGMDIAVARIILSA
ncbi:MAG: permease, partial [Desulfobacteraceae bacterium]|nr:permease [Desulfobacteraceae bacterium]